MRASSRPPSTTSDSPTPSWTRGEHPDRGNDIGFLEIVLRCAAVLPLGAPCRDVYVRGGDDELSRRIVATAPKVRAALAAAPVHPNGLGMQGMAAAVVAALGP